MLAKLKVFLNLYPFFLCLGILASSTVKAQDNYFLELKVSTYTGKKKLEGVTVSVVVDSVILFRKVESDKSGKCRVQLPVDKKYTVTFSKEGYVTKIIRVNTHMPKNRRALYRFQFTIDLFKEVPGLDVSVLKEPIAKITYNNFMAQFDYDANYTVKVNEDLKKLYADYYRLQKK